MRWQFSHIACMPAAIDKTILIDAALSVWREEGYRTATTLKVAQRAGVGEVTLFRRFGSKSALFQAALESEASRFQATGVTYSGDLTADLSAMVDAYQSLLALNGAIVLDVLVESPKNAELAAIAKTPMHAIQAASRVLMRYQDRGALRPGDPLVLVSALLAPWSCDTQSRAPSRVWRSSHPRPRWLAHF